MIFLSRWLLSSAMSRLTERREDLMIVTKIATMMTISTRTMRKRRASQKLSLPRKRQLRRRSNLRKCPRRQREKKLRRNSSRVSRFRSKLQVEREERVE